MDTKTLYVVVPCYNDENVVKITSDALCKKLRELISLGKISIKSKICFLDDGSKDNTWEIISQLCKTESLVTGIRPAYNCGEQRAYFIGMKEAVKYADMIITADSDLQDDINAMDEMIDLHYSGYEIVYGVRSSRESDTMLKRTSSHIFYAVMKAVGTELIPEHSQYRLMGKKAVEELLKHNETNIFLPALIPTLGFSQTVVYYERLERAAGESHYSFGMLLKMGVDAAVLYGRRTVYIIALLALLCLVAGIIFIVRGAFLLSAIWLTGAVIQGTLLPVCLLARRSCPAAGQKNSER